MYSIRRFTYRLLRICGITRLLGSISADVTSIFPITVKIIDNVKKYKFPNLPYHIVYLRSNYNERDTYINGLVGV